jgi:predicted ATPase
LASVPARNDNQKLAAFKKHIEQLLIVHPIPIPKSGSSGLEEEKLDYYARKFVPWYRYLNDDGRFVRSLSESLETVFEGFESISTPQKQGVASFILRFRPNGQALEFDYNELSDGQRMLIILYSLLHLADHGLNDGYPFILCIDEPENAVTLREIQPWLSQLSEVCHEGRLQAILISQHPSSINYLGGGRDGCGYWFDRPRVDSHSLIKRVNADLDDLSLSQLMERGWFDPNGS